MYQFGLNLCIELEDLESNESITGLGQCSATVLISTLDGHNGDTYELRTAIPGE